MLFELNQPNGDYRVTLNGETREEVEYILAALGYVSAGQVVPPPEGSEPRTIVGQLSPGWTREDVGFMVVNAIKLLPDGYRSAGSGNIDFRETQGSV